MFGKFGKITKIPKFGKIKKIPKFGKIKKIKIVKLQSYRNLVK